MDFGFLRTMRVGLALLIFINILPGRARTPIAPPVVREETLNSDVGWSVFTAGKVVATLKSPENNPGGLAEIITTARSQGFASLLFKVQDDFHSYFDPHSLCSSRILRTVDENIRHRRIEIDF